MPIRPSERVRYPKNWAQIRDAIRARSGGQCECRGECRSIVHSEWIAASRDVVVGTRCPALHRQQSPYTGADVVLTVAHLDHTPEHCEPENLRAMCQSCHLNYDREHHAESRAATLAARKAST